MQRGTCWPRGESPVGAEYLAGHAPDVEASSAGVAYSSVHPTISLSLQVPVSARIRSRRSGLVPIGRQPGSWGAIGPGLSGSTEMASSEQRTPRRRCSCRRRSSRSFESAKVGALAGRVLCRRRLSHPTPPTTAVLSKVAARRGSGPPPPGPKAPHPIPQSPGFSRPDRAGTTRCEDTSSLNPRSR